MKSHVPSHDRNDSGTGVTGGSGATTVANIDPRGDPMTKKTAMTTQYQGQGVTEVKKTGFVVAGSNDRSNGSKTKTDAGATRGEQTGYAQAAGNPSARSGNGNHVVKKHISSILIGVEGCAPGKSSPFKGVEHDTSGKSNYVSVRGGRKWRAYATNLNK